MITLTEYAKQKANCLKGCSTEFAIWVSMLKVLSHLEVYHPTVNDEVMQILQKEIS